MTAGGIGGRAKRRENVRTMSESWIARWQEGHTGWHEPEGNAGLHRHWQWRNRRVLVPLCGKSVDMLWLEAQGNEVVGVELSDIAVVAFFEDNGLAWRKAAGGRRFEAVDRRITIHCGDYFDFDAGGFDAHYDRGALVAISPALRERYVQHTNALLADDARQLVVTLEYDQSQANGPPYSVSADEVASYWPALEVADARDDIGNAPEKFRAAGLDRMIEKVWLSPGRTMP
jgi:thiopurine S-methyltransferase